MNRRKKQCEICVSFIEQIDWQKDVSFCEIGENIYDKTNCEWFEKSGENDENSN